MKKHSGRLINESLFLIGHFTLLVAKGAFLLTILLFLPLTLLWIGAKWVCSRPLFAVIGKWLTSHLLPPASFVAKLLHLDSLLASLRRVYGGANQPETPPEARDVLLQETGGMPPVESLGRQAQTMMVTPVEGTLAQSPQPLGWLQVKSGVGAGQSFPLGSPSLTIGRAADNDLVIDDPTVSRHHARISWQNGQFIIQDLGSRSGTLVDGHSAPSATLSPGSALQLGETSLVFSGAQDAQVTQSGALSAAHVSQTPSETVVLPATTGILAWLAVTAGPLQGKTFQLKPGVNTLGRGPDNHVVLPDSSVSRHHAVVRVEEGAFLVADLGSSSGTSIDGRRLEGKALKVGARVTIGQSRLRLLEVEEPEAPGTGTLSGDTVVYRAGSGKGGVLLVEAGPDAGQSFPLSAQGSTVVGRDSQCDVVLRDGAVSRQHCLLRGTGQGFVVYDLGSRGGTLVDGVALRGQVVQPGSVVSLGHTQLVIMLTTPSSSKERQ